MTAVFVYGTFMPGELRWPLLEPFAESVRSATTSGRIWDTGREFPTARSLPVVRCTWQDQPVRQASEPSLLEPVISVNHPRRLELAALRDELNRHWRAETSFWPDEWTPARPSVGQCAVTAMIVQDRFGGDVLRTLNGGVVHYWNRVDDVEVDLTRDQFDTWAPDADVVTVDRRGLASSGPTIATRHRRLAVSLRG
jgi:hypothetical protein